MVLLHCMAAYAIAMYATCRPLAVMYSCRSAGYTYLVTLVCCGLSWLQSDKDGNLAKSWTSPITHDAVATCQSGSCGSGLNAFHSSPGLLCAHISHHTRCIGLRVGREAGPSNDPNAISWCLLVCVSASVCTCHLLFLGPFWIRERMFPRY